MAEKNMRCAYWREGDMCAKFSDDECDNFCVLGPCSAQVPSNADRIRAMTDEELAAWLVNFCCATCGDAANARLAMYHDGLFDWLKQEVEQDEP